MTVEFDELMKQAARCVEQGDLSTASKHVDAGLKMMPKSLAAHNIREKYRLAGNFSDWMGVDGQISEDDDIYRFFQNHPTSLNPVRDYLSDGWRTMLELQEVMDLSSVSLRSCSSFLEFACGHGRFTRHLARVFTGQQLTVSDVVPGSVDFLKNAFNVNGFYSITDPAALVMPGRYDVIFVLSLFSHLPTPTWRAWFKALHAALEPGGILIFSTHGEKNARMAGVTWDASGHVFFPSSESTVLDGQTYGCTYASLEFVKNEIIQTLGSAVEIQSIPSHFWGSQDAVSVKKLAL